MFLQVYFAAINCWYWYGECHQHFPKIRTFPLVLAYIGGNKGIQYKGPLTHAYIEKFLTTILRPLERVETVSDLLHLLTKSHVSFKKAFICWFILRFWCFIRQAVVTGYFNFTQPKPFGFQSFYIASSRYLEHDVHRSVAFAVVTNPSAAKALGIEPIQPGHFDIRLHLWNETLV